MLLAALARIMGGRSNIPQIQRSWPIPGGMPWFQTTEEVAHVDREPTPKKAGGHNGDSRADPHRHEKQPQINVIAAAKRGVHLPGNKQAKRDYPEKSDNEGK